MCPKQVRKACGMLTSYGVETDSPVPRCDGGALAASRLRGARWQTAPAGGLTATRCEAGDDQPLGGTTEGPCDVACAAAVADFPRHGSGTKTACAAPFEARCPGGGLCDRVPDVTSPLASMSSTVTLDLDVVLALTSLAFASAPGRPRRAGLDIRVRVSQPAPCQEGCTSTSVAASP
jgi:hypothetical protein